MHIKDLIADDQDSTKISHTKFWSNVAHAVATVVFIKQAWAGTLDYDIWLIYLGIVGAQGVSHAFLSRGKAAKVEVVN